MKMAPRSIHVISKKTTDCTCGTLFFLISKKQICTYSALFVFPCRCFVQRCFVGLKGQTPQLHIIFMEELSYVQYFTQYFASCVYVRFYFSLPLIFTLLAASISHWPFLYQRTHYPTGRTWANICSSYGYASQV